MVFLVQMGTVSIHRKNVNRKKTNFSSKSSIENFFIEKNPLKGRFAQIYALKVGFYVLNHTRTNKTMDKVQFLKLTNMKHIMLHVVRSSKNFIFVFIARVAKAALRFSILIMPLLNYLFQRVQTLYTNPLT
ncbi:hypothetical protein BpHYR1_051004 [Brachionus plicatilis]|uniref:Uncharacterized protein n=1 Tax=Brachionus plicatilis TaxID=10195 RepID=A0A3M7SQC8_BRAPC|nr:hypothetical protein BpHYR1_051004 [Brachionus plicatilis]